MNDKTPDVLSEPPDEPVVHWMERPPSTLGPATITGALAGAFVLGVLATLGAITVARIVAGHDD
jgi:hypothetical protein